MPQDNHPAPDERLAQNPQAEVRPAEAEAEAVPFQIRLPRNLVGEELEEDGPEAGDGGIEDEDDEENGEEGPVEPTANTPLFRELRAVQRSIQGNRPDASVTAGLAATIAAGLRNMQAELRVLARKPQLNLGPVVDKLTTIGVGLGKVEAAIREDKEVDPRLIAALIASLSTSGNPNNNAEGRFIRVLIALLSRGGDPGVIIDTAIAAGPLGRFANVTTRQLRILPSILGAILRDLRPVRVGVLSGVEFISASDTPSERRAEPPTPSEGAAEDDSNGTEVDVEAGSGTEADTDTEGDTDTEAETDTETDTDIEEETETETATETEAEAESETETEVEPETGEETESGVAPEVEAQPGPGAETATEPAVPAADDAPEAATETGTEPEEGTDNP